MTNENIGSSEMGKVTEHLLNLITKQVEDKGIVVWYDPENDYTKIIEKLSIPDTTILRYEDSFFGLRAQIEPFLPERGSNL